MTILTNNMYNIDIEEYNELDISRGSTASITTLGDDNDLEDPLPVVPLEINLTPVNSGRQENNIIVDINDILLELEEENNNIENL
jgi:hypothetical protein